MTHPKYNTTPRTHIPSTIRPATTHTSRSWIPGAAVIALAGLAGFIGAVLGSRG